MSREVRVESVAGKPFEQKCSVGGLSWLSDEPTAAGGGDAGPSPYELLLSALGACTSMTIRMYSDRKKWPLEGVAVTLSHAREHSVDCTDCTDDEKTVTPSVDVLQRHIELRGALDEEQRQRLLEIANRCPVHRSLENVIKIRTDLEPYKFYR
jgi:putative redox protein